MPTDTEKEEISESLLLRIDDIYPLYAITNNKKYAKRFERERDMNQFLKVITDDVDKTEWEEYGNKNRNSVLEIAKLITRCIDKNGKESPVKSMYVEVLITFWEKSTVSDDMNYTCDDDYFWRKQESPYLYKNKYVEAFRKLQYIKYYNLYNIPLTAISGDDEDNMSINTKFMSYEGDDDYDAPSCTIDELSQFISKYGSTFKK